MYCTNVQFFIHSYYINYIACASAAHTTRVSVLTLLSSAVSSIVYFFFANFSTATGIFDLQRFKLLLNAHKKPHIMSKDVTFFLGMDMEANT